MPRPMPYSDTEIKEGLKRTYWYESEVHVKDQTLKRSAAKAVSKRGKPYSRDDQRKIVKERWQEVCEKHRPAQEC